MSKSVIAVLVCTFCALAAATVWVPVEWAQPRAVATFGSGAVFVSGEDPRYMTLFDLFDSRVPPRYADYDDQAVAWASPWRIRWLRLVLTLGVILALGGLLALFFRTRAARGAA